MVEKVSAIGSIAGSIIADIINAHMGRKRDASLQKSRSFHDVGSGPLSPIAVESMLVMNSASTPEIDMPSMSRYPEYVALQATPDITRMANTIARVSHRRVGNREDIGLISEYIAAGSVFHSGSEIACPVWALRVTASVNSM
jgi:hypothetical protein